MPFQGTGARGGGDFRMRYFENAYARLIDAANSWLTYCCLLHNRMGERERERERGRAVAFKIDFPNGC